MATLITTAASAISSIGAIQAGRSQQAASNYQAAQLEAAAKTERAVAQREAMEERRQKDLMISRARAVGAASGGGQDISLLGEIEEDAELRALTAIWQGEEAAKGRKAQAAASRFEGQQLKRAGFTKGVSTLLAGATTFADKYS